MSVATLQFLQAFNLNSIALQQFNKHQEEIDKRRESSERLSVSYVMSQKGFVIAQLFGYHLSRQIKQNLYDIGKSRNLIRLNYHNFVSLITQLWINIGQYRIFLPIIFNILKGYNNTITLKHFDQYIQMCRKTINPYMAKIKQSIAPMKMKQMIEQIGSLCEKQDLKSNGLVEKMMIVDLIKKYIEKGKENVQIDERLIKNDEIVYQKLLGPQYLTTGRQIREFLQGKLCQKIKKVVKKIGELKKKKKKKKDTKAIGTKPSLKKIQTKKTKFIKQFMQQNKKEIKKDTKNLQIMMKSLLYQIIYSSAEIAYLESPPRPIIPIKKSIYTTEPTIIEHELSALPDDSIKVYPSLFGSGIFVSQRSGKIINLMDGSIGSAFNLDASYLLKNSSIIDYNYFNNILYLLRQDGLLYSWDNKQNCYRKLIQTQFSYRHKKIEQLNNKKCLLIHQGLIMINSSQKSNCFQFYSLQLQYLGNVFINKFEFGIIYSILKEAFLLKDFVKEMKSDYEVKSKEEYENFIRTNYQYQEYQLANYLFSRYSHISISKLTEYLTWTLSYNENNKITINKSMASRLKNKKPSEEDYQYLLKFNYIDQKTPASCLQFLKRHKIIQIDLEQRRNNLITLFEDIGLKQIDKYYVSRRELLSYLQRCNLNDSESKNLFQNLQYNPKGQINLHNMLLSQQFRKIYSLRNNRFYPPQHYKHNELPPVIFNVILPFPFLDFILATTIFPSSHLVYILSMQGIIIHKINLNQYIQTKNVHIENVVLSYCEQSGFLAICFNNIVTIWNINHISSKTASPIKIIKGLDTIPIIGLQFLYYSNTLATLTQRHIKFWDINQILFSSETSDVVFKMKPGYRAIETRSEMNKWQCKKKVMIRGKGVYSFGAPTKTSNYIVGVVSVDQTKRKVFIKLFYLSKFNILLSSNKRFQLVPTKILRQLQEQARKSKYNQELIDTHYYQNDEHKLITTASESLKNQLSSQEQNQLNKASMNLIIKITTFSSICTDFTKILDDSAFSKEFRAEDTKIFNFNLLLKMYLCNEDGQLRSMFRRQFIELYQSSSGAVDRQGLISDLFDGQDLTCFNRTLCLLGLIYKYSASYKCNYLDLIKRQNESTINSELVRSLIANSQMSKTIIQNTCNYINNIKIGTITDIVTKIIDHYLPTEYRFPSLRYYKNINTHSPDHPFDYFINRFENFIAIDIKEEIKSPKGYSHIFQHIQKENLLQRVQKLIELNPYILKDNLQLIDSCMSHNLITEQEATFYYLNPSHNSTILSLMSKGSQVKKILYNMDDIVTGICFVIKQSKLRLPSPQFTYQWFYDNFKTIIGNDDKLYNIFYNQLKGSLTNHLAYTNQLQFYIQLSKKSIAINYNPLNWKSIIGTRIYPLTYYMSQLRNDLGRQKLMKSYRFESILSRVVPKEAKSLTVRSTVACKNHQSYIKQFNEQKSTKEYTEDFINVEHFMYFLEQSKVERQSKALAISQINNNKTKLQIKIPSYILINILSNFTAYLSNPQILELLAYNLSHCTYSQVTEWVNEIKFTRMKSKKSGQRRVCSIWELKECFKMEWGMLGWMMLIKYGRLNVLSKCIIVQGFIQSKQITQVLMSEAITKLFLSHFQLKQSNQAYSFETLQSVINKELIHPAISSLTLVFLHSISSQFQNIVSFLLTIAVKHEEIAFDKLVQFFVASESVKQSMIKLILGTIFDKTKKLKIREVVEKIGLLIKERCSSSESETDSLKQWLTRLQQKNENVVQKVVNASLPHQILNKKSISSQSFMITQEHLSSLIGKKINWVYAYQPFFTLPQFFDHLHHITAINPNIYLFVVNCALKLGIHTFYSSIQSFSFPQFLTKIKSISKNLAKLTYAECSQLFRDLCDDDKKISKEKLFKAVQLQIIGEERVSWMIEYKEKLSRLQVIDDFSISRFANLVVNLQNLQSQAVIILSSLNYEEYLIKKYIKSANKLVLILKEINNKVSTLASLTELNFQYDQIEACVKYLKQKGQEVLFRMRDAENKATQQLDENEQKILLEQISAYLSFIQKFINLQDKHAMNVNYPITQATIKQTSLYKAMISQNNPEWSCLTSYINLYFYCKHLIINKIYCKKSYRQLIIDQFHKTLISTSLSLKNVYDIFNLAYLDNLTKYLPFFVVSKPQHHALNAQIYHKTSSFMFQAFIKYNGTKENKFPLSLSNFKELFGIIQLKNESKLGQHGSLYKKLNLSGCGFVNLNDIPQFRGKNQSNPYVQINSFISTAYPSAKQWRKINPPSELSAKKDTLIPQIIKLQQPSQLKFKLIHEDHLWRLIGFYLTQQHRLFIQHQFKYQQNPKFYNIVTILDWINNDLQQQQQKGAEILVKLIERIEQAGGVYNILRTYNKNVILSQQIDNLKQQKGYLNVFIQESQVLEVEVLRTYIKKLVKDNISEHWQDENKHRHQNKLYLEEVLILIVNTYNREIRQWSNYNNNLVTFLNELSQTQFSLIQKLYEANHHYNYHQLFNKLSDGGDSFTFNTFWIYNMSSDEAYPYARSEVEEVYKIIDVNSDGSISYQQFSRFWNAIEQIYSLPKPQQTNKMKNLKSTITELFLEILQNALKNQVYYDTSKLSISQLQSITNIKNKQKIQRLIKIINPGDKMVEYLDIHKMKVLLKQFIGKKTTAKKQHFKQHNYFAQVLGPIILQYIHNKESLQNILNKWLVFTYPNLGCYLAQLFNDQFNWSKSSITNWVRKYEIKDERQAEIQRDLMYFKGSENINENIQQNSMILYDKIKDNPALMNIFYKKFLKKNISPKKYGQSISFRLYLTKILTQYRKLLQETTQIQTFLQNIQQPAIINLIYPLEQKQSWKYEIKLTQLSKFKEFIIVQKLTFIRMQETINIRNNLSLDISYHESLRKSQYKLINSQLRGKSNNRFSLISNKKMYDDPKISLSIYDEQKSNNNNLVLYTDLTLFKPFVQLTISFQNKFTSLNTMIKVVELAHYISKEYHIIGLFANLSNICINLDSQTQFKVISFYSGIRLDNDYLYVQGVNPLDINQQSDKYLIYPPELYDNIFTETFDSYCLAHILYYLFTGQFVQNSKIKPYSQESHWFNYSSLHNKCKKHLQVLAMASQNVDREGEIVFYTMLAECTQFQWHLRPKPYQILQILQNLGQMNQSLSEVGKKVLMKKSIKDICLQHLKQDSYELFSQRITSIIRDRWSIEELIIIRQNMPKDPRYYMIYNQILINSLHYLDENNSLEEISAYMKNAVQYLCSSNRKSTQFLALQTYKDIISAAVIKRYFNYCDQLWKIKEFSINQKLVQLNMQNRVDILQKSSQYYIDLSTLIESKITLFLSDSSQSKAKKQDSTKKLAISFIQSSLLSNNVNKICALQKSEVMVNLYKYLEDKEFEDMLLRIYRLATNCLNVDNYTDNHRTVEQCYKIMMVMHNIISLQKGLKKGETVIDMLSFMNNYYNFYGQECKSVVLKNLCKTQICNLPTLMYLFNCKITNRDILFQILVNLSCELKYYKLSKSVTVHAYQSYLKQIKKTLKYQSIKNKLEKLINYHEVKITLFELSSWTNVFVNKMELTSKEASESYFHDLERLIQKHMNFHEQRQTFLKKGENYKYQNNFFEHFCKFLELTRNICKDQIANSYYNTNYCNIVQLIFNLHQKLINLWQVQELTIKYFMAIAEIFYEKEFLYIENMLINKVQAILLRIFIKLLKKQKNKMIRLGFVHFFNRIMKKQHELIKKYIEKGVENMQLSQVYAQESQFRLNVLNILIQDNNEETHRLFILIGFPKYLIQVMLASKIILDLRYYKGNFNIVPFRYCNPMRSEAIVMLNFILPLKTSFLKSELVSRLIPVLPLEKDNLIVNDENAQIRMKLVQTLWLFGIILDCQDELLKYQFVNNKCYEMLDHLVQKYPYLGIFFPKMTETVKTGTIMKSSLAFSRLISK